MFGDDFEALLARQSGVVSMRQALRFTTQKVVWGRARSGRWQVPYQGIYVNHNGPLTSLQELWVASLAMGKGAPTLLGGLTALTIHGLQRMTSQYVEALVPRRRQFRRPPEGVRVHRVAGVKDEDICFTAPPTTSPARSLVDAASWARTDTEARTIIAMCFQQRLVKLGDVERVVASRTRLRRRTLILDTAADAAGGAHSLGELDLVALCRRANLPMPSRQARRRDAAGRMRYLDAFFDEWGVWVEVDGGHHMSVDQWWEDMDRHNDLSSRGQVLLRFPSWKVRRHPDEVAERIRRALVSAGWRDFGT